MVEIKSQIYQHLSLFIEKIHKTFNQLLKDIRKSGQQNIPARYYLKEFKIFLDQLKSQEPLKEIFKNSTLQIFQKSLQNENPENEKYLVQNRVFADKENLKLVIKRQLVLFQSQEVKFQEICKLLLSVEFLIKEIQIQNQYPQNNCEEIKSKLLPIYGVIADWLKVLSIIIQNVVQSLESHLESVLESSINFQKSIISPDQNCKSVLTSILSSPKRNNKPNSRSDSSALRELPRQSRVNKRLVTRFQIGEKPLMKQVKPKSLNKYCGGCLFG